MIARHPTLVLLCVGAAACSPSDLSIGTSAGTGGGTAGSSASAGGGSAGGAPAFTPDSFFTGCSGAPTTLSGVAVAPNGTDPISAAEIAVWDHVPTPLPTGVACENCMGTVIDLPLLSTLASTDGRFSLNLDTLKQRANYVVTVRKARFRRVLTNVPITACGATVLAKAALPRDASEGDMPKIAISSGNRDHLEKVVDAMGITGYDCVKGLPRSSTTDTCAAARTLGDLINDPSRLDQYGLLFISCAVSNPYSPSSGDDDTAKRLRAWVERGGKLVVTDDSYDFVEQTFPDAIDFQGPAAAAGRPQAVDGAEVGTPVDTVTGVVDDPGLAAWLALFPSAINGARQVTLRGFLSDWAVQRAPGPNTTVVVHGKAPFSSSMADVPLTSRFEVKGCGRVIYSSYHTDSSGTLLPQERILEYLMFEVAACTVIPN